MFLHKYKKYHIASSRDHFLNKSAANGKNEKIKKMAAPDHVTFFAETENSAFLVSVGLPWGADMLGRAIACSMIIWELIIFRSHIWDRGDEWVKVKQRRKCFSWQSMCDTRHLCHTTRNTDLLAIQFSLIFGWWTFT